jgi:hypothetical protein
MAKSKQLQKERKQLKKNQQKVMQSDEQGYLRRCVNWKTMKLIKAI